MVEHVSDFRPVWYARGGHRQTAFALWLARPTREPPGTVPHQIALPDGDRVVLHVSPPTAPGPADGRIALMVHGLAGSHASPYCQRIAGKLLERGVRTARLDLRTCGAGMALATRPYHAGRSEDVRAAVAKLAELVPGAPVRLVGFSLGGSMCLKLAGEAPAPANLASVMSICSPLDLAHDIRLLESPVGRLYDRFFAGLLAKHLAEWTAANPAAPRIAFAKPPRSIREIDERVTAPLGGFADAADYYARCSAVRFLPSIGVPTEILAAADDPLASAETLRRAAVAPLVRRRLAPRGGHLGFLARGPVRRWMDTQVLAHVLGPAER